MADILYRSNFYFTFPYNLRILWLIFCLRVWQTEQVPLVHWSPTILFLLFRMKTICVSKHNLEILLQFSRLLDYWPSGLLSMVLWAMFQGK